MQFSNAAAQLKVKHNNNNNKEMEIDAYNYSVLFVSTFDTIMMTSHGHKEIIALTEIEVIGRHHSGSLSLSHRCLVYIKTSGTYKSSSKQPIS